MSWHEADSDSDPVVFFDAIVHVSTLVTYMVAGIMTAPTAVVRTADCTAPLAPTLEGQKFPQSCESHPTPKTSS